MTLIKKVCDAFESTIVQHTPFIIFKILITYVTPSSRKCTRGVSKKQTICMDVIKENMFPKKACLLYEGYTFQIIIIGEDNGTKRRVITNMGDALQSHTLKRRGHPRKILIRATYLNIKPKTS